MLLEVCLFINGTAWQTRLPASKTKRRFGSLHLVHTVWGARRYYASQLDVMLCVSQQQFPCLSLDPPFRSRFFSSVPAFHHGTCQRLASTKSLFAESVVFIYNNGGKWSSLSFVLWLVVLSFMAGCSFSFSVSQELSVALSRSWSAQMCM